MKFKGISLLLFVYSALLKCAFGSLDLGSLLERIPEDERQRISLRADIISGVESFATAKAQNLKKLDTLTNELSWLKGTGLIEPKFIDSAQEAVAEEVKELELGERLVKAKSIEKLKTFESDALLILQRHSGLAKVKPFDSAEIEKIKKWLLTCSIWGSACPKDAMKLIDWDRSAIVRLQKNLDLLRKLSEDLKVFLWPTELNFPFFLGSGSDLSKSREEMRTILKFIEKPVESDGEFEMEMKKRLEVFDKFLELDKPAQLELRLRALERVVDVLVQKKTASSAGISESERKILQIWIFAYQMLYARDWLSRSGRFVKPWPENSPSPPPGFKLPELTDDGGYFGAKNNEVIEAEMVAGFKVEVSALKPKSGKKSGFFSSWLGKSSGSDSDNAAGQATTTTTQKVSNFIGSLFGKAPKSEQSKDGGRNAEDAKETPSTVRRVSNYIGSLFKRDENPVEPPSELAAVQSQTESPAKPAAAQKTGYLGSFFKKTVKSESPSDETTVEHAVSESKKEAAAINTAGPEETKSEIQNESKKSGLFGSFFTKQKKPPAESLEKESTSQVSHADEKQVEKASPVIESAVPLSAQDKYEETATASNGGKSLGVFGRSFSFFNKGSSSSDKAVVSEPTKPVSEKKGRFFGFF